MDEKDLHRLYASRVKDYVRAKSKKKRQREALPEKMDSLVKTYFKNDKEALQKMEEARLLSAWPNLVGKAGAAVSSALKLRGRQLIVKVSDPVWRQQFVLLRRDLVTKIRKEFPGIGLTDIYFH